MSKIKKWSQALAIKAAYPSKIFYAGEQYVYDTGALPSGVSALPGDVLSVQREPGITAHAFPGSATDWLVIRNSGTTQLMINESLAVEPGKVVANLGTAAATFPKTTIPELFKQLPLNILLDMYGYGACRNREISDPRWTPCGNPLLALQMPFHNLRRCLANDEGDILAYLDENNSTKLESGDTANLSGEEDPELEASPVGQVMIEIPACYRYHFVAQGVEYVYLSAEDFEVPENVQKFRIKPGTLYSAYEAALKKGEKPMLSSVVNTTDDYIGGSGASGQSEWTDDQDLHGRPKTNLSLGDFRKYARNRGEEWNCDVYYVYNHICWLFFIEHLTWNSQGVDAIGVGVSDWTDSAWNTFNGYNPFVPCGYTNELGNASGKVALTVSGKTFYVPSYRGIENPFGHIWSKMDGILANAVGGELLVYLCDDPASFADTLNDGYRLLGKMPATSNYFLKNIPGHVLPIAGSPTGSATTGRCDYFYAPSANAGIRGVLFGGYALAGTYDGLSFVHALTAPSYAYANLGSRLCFLPKD